MKSILVRVLLAVFLFTSFSVSGMPFADEADSANHDVALASFESDAGSTGDVDLGCDHACHAAQHFHFSVDNRPLAAVRLMSGPVIAPGLAAPLPRSIDPLRRPPRA